MRPCLLFFAAARASNVVYVVTDDQDQMQGRQSRNHAFPRRAPRRDDAADASSKFRRRVGPEQSARAVAASVGSRGRDDLSVTSKSA